MKKSILLLLCLLPISLSALPTGNPSAASLLCRGVFLKGRYEEYGKLPMCDVFSLRLGYYGDYVYNRRMEVDSGSRSGTIHKTEIYTNAGYLALNVCNRLDVYGTLGASFFRLATPQSAFAIVSNPNRYYFLDTESHFSYTVGANATILRFRRLCLGVDGKYFYTCPKVNSTHVERFDIQYVDARLKYREWQVALGASYTVPLLDFMDVVPYATIKWAEARADFGNALDVTQEQLLFDLKNAHSFGYSIGFTLVGESKWDITAEARFYDELAFAFNTQFRF